MCVEPHYTILYALLFKGIVHYIIMYVHEHTLYLLINITMKKYVLVFINIKISEIHISTKSIHCINCVDSTGFQWKTPPRLMMVCDDAYRNGVGSYHKINVRSHTPIWQTAGRGKMSPLAPSHQCPRSSRDPQKARLISGCREIFAVLI